MATEADAIGQLREAHAAPLNISVDARSRINHSFGFKAEYAVRWQVIMAGNDIGEVHKRHVSSASYACDQACHVMPYIAHEQ